MSTQVRGTANRKTNQRRRSHLPRIAALAVAIGAILSFHPQQAQSEPVQVDLLLVLAVDVSSSMSREELEIQRSGYVTAIKDPLFVTAIQLGATGRIAVAFVEWAGPDFQVLTMPWQVIDSSQAAQRFADELTAKPLRGGTDTSISKALLFSAALLSDRSYQATRKVIDVSGDGPNTTGPYIVPARDSVVAEGITINALPLLLNPAPSEISGDAELLRYFESCVIGGPGAFAFPVRNTDGLVAGIRRKLILEVAWAEPHPVAVLASDWSPADCRAGQKEFYE